MKSRPDDEFEAFDWSVILLKNVKSLDSVRSMTVTLDAAIPRYGGHWSAAERIVTGKAVHEIIDTLA